MLAIFLAEDVTIQFRLLFVAAPCWMEVPWLATVLNMLEDVPHQCHIVKDLVTDISVGSMPKGVPLLYVTLCLLSNVCCIDKGSIPQSYQAVVRVTQGSPTKVYP